MITAHILFAVFLLLGTVASHVHLASENRFEGLQSLLLATLVNANTVIVKLLDAEHIAMVRDGQAAHTIGYGLVHQILNLRLSVKYRIISMYV